MAQPWFVGPFKNAELWRAKLNLIFGEIASGINAGITQLTGDVTTASGGGSQAATIANGAVTYAKMQDVSAASKLLGRGAASGAGDVQEVTLGSGLSMTGTTLSATASGSGIDQLTGDVTAGPGSGSQAATIAADAVTNAKLANMAASLIKARKTGSTGDPEDCTLSEVLDLIGSAAQGDVLYRGSSGWARLGAGTAGQFLKTQGAGANPAWAAPPANAVTFKGCRLYRSAALTISAATVIGWDAESFDTDNLHDNTTNNDRITIPAAYNGLYAELVFGLSSSASVTGQLVSQIQMIRSAVTYNIVTQDTDTAGGDFVNCSSGPILLATGDIFRAEGNAASSRAIDVGEFNGTFFSLTVLGA